MVTVEIGTELFVLNRIGPAARGLFVGANSYILVIWLTAAALPRLFSIDSFDYAKRAFNSLFKASKKSSVYMY